MADKEKRLLILGSGSNGGGGTQVQADWAQTDTTLPSYIQNKPELSTVATSGSYNDLTDTPTIPTVNDATITLQSGDTTIDTFSLNQSSNKTITIPSGGDVWTGTQAQFDAIPVEDLNMDTSYLISDKLTVNDLEGGVSWSDVQNAPTIPVRVGELPNDAMYQNKSDVQRIVKNAIKEYDKTQVWLTQAEYDTLSANNQLVAGTNYHIEGPQSAIEMVVTFTDSTTATYNVYVQQ